MSSRGISPFMFMWVSSLPFLARRGTRGEQTTKTQENNLPIDHSRDKSLCLTRTREDTGPRDGFRQVETPCGRVSGPRSLVSGGVSTETLLRLLYPLMFDDGRLGSSWSTFSVTQGNLGVLTGRTWVSGRQCRKVIPVLVLSSLPGRVGRRVPLSQSSPFPVIGSRDPFFFRRVDA